MIKKTSINKIFSYRLYLWIGEYQNKEVKAVESIVEKRSGFDPYFQQMKVDLLYFDKVLAPYDYKMETFSLEKVSKEDIPYFNETEKPAQTDLFEMIEEETNQL